VVTASATGGLGGLWTLEAGPHQSGLHPQPRASRALSTPAGKWQGGGRWWPSALLSDAPRGCQGTAATLHHSASLAQPHVLEQGVPLPLVQVPVAFYPRTLSSTFQVSPEGGLELLPQNAELGVLDMEVETEATKGSQQIS
jgi:hypothetical protein